MLCQPGTADTIPAFDAGAANDMIILDNLERVYN